MAEHNDAMQIELRPCDGSETLPETPSEFEEWGDRDPAALPVGLERWLVIVDGDIVGTMSAHPHRYGPTAGSMSMNIGIALVPEKRGRGIGSAAQRMLAELFHTRGVHRVEASTDVLNIAEQRALAKAGFELEGIARGAQVRADGRHDLQVWSHMP